MTNAERETYNAMVLEIDAWKKAATKVGENAEWDKDLLCYTVSKYAIEPLFEMMGDFK